MRIERDLNQAFTKTPPDLYQIQVELYHQAMVREPAGVSPSKARADYHHALVHLQQARRALLNGECSLDWFDLIVERFHMSERRLRRILRPSSAKSRAL
jgi:hypothetical protein